MMTNIFNLYRHQYTLHEARRQQIEEMDEHLTNTRAAERERIRKTFVNFVKETLDTVSFAGSHNVK